MTEQQGNTAGGARFELGLDGKPYEVWEPAPSPAPPARHEQAWVSGSFHPRGAAESEMLQVPRISMEFNHFAWYSLGLGGFVLLFEVISWALNSGGLPWIMAFALAGVGFYFGMRSHNASLRGFCTNGGLGRAGLVVSILAALVTAAMIVRVVGDVNRAVSGT